MKKESAQVDARLVRSYEEPLKPRITSCWSYDMTAR